MFLRAVIFFCVLSSVTLAAAQTRSAASTSASQSSTAATSTTQAVRTEEIAALRDDIRKMRGLVQQMGNNLAFVSDTQSPLKHQFELDIQMWNIVIGQMERRVDALERH